MKYDNSIRVQNLLKNEISELIIDQNCKLNENIQLNDIINDQEDTIELKEIENSKLKNKVNEL